MERYLDDGSTVIVLSNSYSPVAQDGVFLEGLHAAVFGRAARPPALLPVAVKAGTLAELAGRYQMPHEYFVPDATIELVDRGDRLEAVWETAPATRSIRLGPIGSGTGTSGPT